MKIETICLKALASNQYVSAWVYGDKRPSLLAEAPHIKEWELFDICYIDDRLIALKARSTGRFVSAWGEDEEAPLVADAIHIKEWELFDICYIDDRLIALKALANNRYVSAWLYQNGNAPLIAKAIHIKEWELFEYIPISPEKCSEILNLSSEVLNDLYRIWGFGTIAGQHNQESKDENPYDPALSTKNIAQITRGQYPGLWSGDFLYQSGYTDHKTRMEMIHEAVRQWNRGALVNIMWHACPPTHPEPCDWSRVNNNSKIISDDEWEELITDGSELNNVWKSRLDKIAKYLHYLDNNGVEVLWRPFHEMNQSEFWWGGRPGEDGSSRLYEVTYEYLVDEHNLKNLIWVWNLQDFDTLGDDLWDYKPDDECWDIASLDVYESDGHGFTLDKYDAMLNVAGNKPIAIGECNLLPTADELYKQPLWLFFMGWAEDVFDDNSEEEIYTLYESPNVLTRSQVSGRLYG